MIDRRLVFEIHRLKDLGLADRAIARSLNISRDTVAKYLNNPNPGRAPIQRASKLDSFKDEIAKMLSVDPEASGEVIRRRLVLLGFDGGKTIVNDYLKTVRGEYRQKRAFIRFESLPGAQMQIDWGHFDSLTYGNTKRKLYCMAAIECHSRLLVSGVHAFPEAGDPALLPS